MNEGTGWKHVGHKPLYAGQFCATEIRLAHFKEETG